jgi:voltage-gated sodium channel
MMNTVALILDGFPTMSSRYGLILHAFDYACMLFYVFEVVAKSAPTGFTAYWRSGWNKFDFLIVLLGMPLLLDPLVPGQFEGLELVLLLRMGRFLRFFRMLRFIPNVTQIWLGVVRSLQASVGIFLVLFLLNLIMAMGANLLFHEYSTVHFGDPYVSFYTMFKVFTIEGWFEIPDELAANGMESWDLFLIRCYFAFSVVIGGVLGLSLANAVFVDEMTADNNDELERMVGGLKADIAGFREEIIRLQQEHQQQLEELVSRKNS